MKNSNKAQIYFVSYDFKNQLESFKNLKKNNPLCFPEKLVIEVEKKIDINLIQEDYFIESQSIDVKPTISKEDYIKQVNKLKQHIQQGDIYEINYCITFESHDVKINPIAIYNKLNNMSKAPYSALAKFDKHWIMCSSPELFLKKRGTSLITKPIKGTIKRGIIEFDDENNKQLLFNNHKERTENVMIVDVCRNDLSRIAQKGTVEVPLLYDIETYQQVHQMVSTVRCDIKNDLQIEEIINATFPMASMTGAPKIKAMDLADDFELYNRNVYSGTLGYINDSTDFTLNVLIRSIFYNEEANYLSFSVGSAITIKSDAEYEYNECLLKAKAMLQTLH